MKKIITKLKIQETYFLRTGRVMSCSQKILSIFIINYKDFIKKGKKTNLENNIIN
jgi:hypothetical protein